MKTLVFFLEEPSAKEMLDCLLPKILNQDTSYRCIVFQGKQDLEKSLPKRLRGWQHPDSVFIIIRDQDSGDCRTIKQNLVSLCQQAGKANALVRIACHELESFYLGDLKAVEKGLGINGIASAQEKRKFRAPDMLPHPADELNKLTKGCYEKVAGSRAIAPHLDLSRNQSESFNILLQGIRRLIERDP